MRGAMYVEVGLPKQIGTSIQSSRSSGAEGKTNVAIVADPDGRRAGI